MPINISEWVIRAREKHGDLYDYCVTEYIKAVLKVDIICSRHGMFNQRAADHINGVGCPKCGKQQAND